jgi:hypothetical protein
MSAANQENSHDSFDGTRSPCRRLLLGRAGSAAPLSRRDFDPGRLYRRRGAERHLSQPWQSRRGHRKLLEFFFQIHDPSTLNRQGNDRGASYRSAIFYTSDAQKRIAEDTIADVDASGLWPGKVVTEVAPAGPFWEAEPEHQDYLEKYPDGYTCHFIRPDWVLPHRAEKVAAGGGASAA